jgi:hypothetical protein
VDIHDEHNTKLFSLKDAPNNHKTNSSQVIEMGILSGDRSTAPIHFSPNKESNDGPIK